jgi:hypothetical protein
VNIAYTVIDNGDGTFSASRTISVELYYIYSDVTFNSQAGDTITVSALPDSIPTLFPAPPAIPVNGAFLSGGLPRFFTVTQTVPLPLTRVLQPPAGHTIVTYSRGANRLDYSEMDFPQVRLEIGNPGTTIQDVEVDDPAVNDTFNQWTPSSGNGTLGSLNDPSVYKPMDGTVPTGGLPPSKAVMSGKPMQSLGELGYIHLPGVKWKYLTLQPNAVPGVIPDWAMLDLFTVGNTAIPNDVVTGGRININSFINTAVAATPSQPRLVPLEALLKSLSGVIAFPLATVAHQIYNDDDITAPIARLTDPYGMKFVFDTIGEICEINSLMPSGTPKEADKEIAIRRLGNLITVRSNTFTIWVIAQSIKEPTGLAGQSIGMFQPGTDLITGEVRAKAVVERYEQAGVVKFRVRYFRYL